MASGHGTDLARHDTAYRVAALERPVRTEVEIEAAPRQPAVVSRQDLEPQVLVILRVRAVLAWRVLVLPISELRAREPRVCERRFR